MRTRRRAKLTTLASCAGCAAKLRVDLLSKILGTLPRVKVKEALIGCETNDDAAVFQLSKSLAIIETVDFFPPLLDDPYAYGQIAAANAMSDVWAMGGKALFALNVVAFPKELHISILEAILAGGASKAQEAGIPVLGGHSIQSPEPKYGMAVTGVVHPKRVLTNAGGKVGDALILTKPIGTGIATTALKSGKASKTLVTRVTAQMAALNKAAGEVFASRQFPVHALTDITGFGLLGHGLELIRPAKLRMLLKANQIPVLPEVEKLAMKGLVPGGTKANLEYVKRWVHFPNGMPEAIRYVLSDAQTNGGLLAAVPEKFALKALDALKKQAVKSWIVGRLHKGKPGIDVV